MCPIVHRRDYVSYSVNTEENHYIVVIPQNPRNPDNIEFYCARDTLPTMVITDQCSLFRIVTPGPYLLKVGKILVLY